MIRFISIGVLASLSMAGTRTAHAEPSCAQLEKAWHNRYAADFEIAWDRKQFTCKGPVGQLALAIHDLDTIQMDPNGRGFKPDFYKTVIRNLEVMAYEPNCPAGRAAQATFKYGRIELCKPFFNGYRESQPMLLVHEARHLDRDDPGHVTCRGGAFNGSRGACDAQFFNADWKGSGYNASIYYLAWLLRRGSPTNDLRRTALQSLLNAWLPDRFVKADPAQVKKWRELK